MREYKRGSERSKWDLHIHTPFSIVQGYGGSKEEIWEKFILDLEALPEEYRVIGINDYSLVDGYEKILEYKKNGRLDKINLILPVLEFRLKEFGGTEELKSINFHVIFSDDVTVEEIKKNFINKLEVEVYDDEKFTITSKQCFADYGKKLKDESIVLDKGSDQEIGFNQARFDRKQILKVLEEYFNGKYLTAIGKNEWESLRWNGAVVDKKKIINSANFVFTASENIEDALKGKEKLKQQEVNSNLLHFSDAHFYSNNTDNFNKIGHSFTWIKANPTFNGLVQVLNEINERVYIGDKPDVIKQVSENKDKYIHELRVTNIDGYDGKKGKWFNGVKIPLNSGLVTIIGNKGSGKSAIADIIGFLGNAQNSDKFSFLHSKKFKARNLARHFEGELLWESGNKSTSNLNDEIDPFSDEEVRYLPQSYFESIANEIYNQSGDTKSKLTTTLENVVYRYLDNSDKLGLGSFDELLKYKMKSINGNIDKIKSELKILNGNIIELEGKRHPDYIKVIENKLNVKNEEIQLLEKSLKDLDKEYNKDKESENQKEGEGFNKKLDKLNTQLLTEEKLISQEEENLLIIKKDLVQLENLLEKYIRLKESLDESINEDKEVFNKFGISERDIYPKEIKIDKLENIIFKKKNEIQNIENLLLSSVKIEVLECENKKSILKNSLVVKKEHTLNEIKTIEKELSTEEKKKHEYEVEKKRINNEICFHKGNKDKHNTKIYFEEELKYIKIALIPELKKLIDKRKELTKDIYEEKKSIVSLYQGFKKPIDDKLSNEQIALKEYTVEVDVGIRAEKNLGDKILGYINQGKAGTFYGGEFGTKAMGEILQYKDFNDINDVIDIIKSIIRALEHDKRENGNNEEKNIIDQVKDIQSFYDFLYSLDYITPEYQLKMMGKQIYELSPGERGTLLLIFYLLIDKENIPLIIDQPEDNLDNQSVYNMLSRFIKNAKKRRQIVIVTHNPNLAIGGDAEQVIYVNLNKKNNENEFTFYSGSIENPKINGELQNILEGTRPAFIKRDNTYFL